MYDNTHTGTVEYNKKIIKKRKKEKICIAGVLYTYVHERLRKSMFGCV